VNEKRRYSIKKILLAILWVSVATGTTVLLVAGVHKNDSDKCKDIVINISGIEADDEKFVDENDIRETIEEVCKQNPVGKAKGSFDLRKIETELEKSKWVKNAELFFDNNNILKVSLQEREPVARIFTTGNTSFYIDTALAMLPLSDRLSARLPVFTGFPSDKLILSAADSALLADIRTISMAIQKDSFRMAMIEQVDITPQRSFEMIPKIGNQVIVFGSAADAEEKFNKLQLFYKNVITKSGWNKYSVISLQYKNQVVAKIKGQEDKTADSVRTLQIMQIIAANAARQAEDSLQTILQDNNNNTADSSMIQQSIQREDNFETTNAINESPLQPTNNQQQAVNPLPLAKPVVVKPAQSAPRAASNPIPTAKPNPVKTTTVTQKSTVKPIAKPVTGQKPATDKPKAVMPNKNDY
jgi:cell division protein FtsQ